MSDDALDIERVRPMLDAIAHPVIITGPDSKIVYWNPAAFEAYGFSEEEALGQYPPDLLGEPDDERLNESVASILENRSWSGELSSRTKYGEPRMMHVTAMPLPGNLGVIATAVDVTTAVADRRRLAEALALVEQQSVQLRHQALHDPLTGLPNRVLVLDRAEQMLARAQRDESQVAALFLDLDNFKDVNDTYGHAAGDDLLRQVANRIDELTRSYETFGRIGGDEFVLVTERTEVDDNPVEVAERILYALHRPFRIEGNTGGIRQSIDRPVTVSIGIAAGTRPSADSLLHDADVAMYRAKSLGKSRYVVFSEEMANP